MRPLLLLSPLLLVKLELAMRSAVFALKLKFCVGQLVFVSLLLKRLSGRHALPQVVASKPSLRRSASLVELYL